jgi:ABC-2 type transport system ATP-binding protein
MTQREIVRVEGLVKDFRPGFGLRRKRVLDGITLSVREGEIFGFVGPNGAGKTTTLKVLLGLIRPTAGHAEILGHPVRETSFRRHIGFLPENPSFYEYLTGREFLRFYARLSGVERRRRDERVELLLAWVGLAHAAGARLRTYSKGMLQRIGIAQALVHDPSVVFLDEPMSGLDPLGRKDIRDLILRLRDEGKTVFMNTHILHDVELLCDRVAILVGGRIRFEGRSEDFRPGGEPESDVVLARVPAELGIRLQERWGDALRGIGERLELRVPRKELEGVLGAALGAGSEVISVTPHRASLETIFLSAVRQGAGEGRR